MKVKVFQDCLRRKSTHCSENDQPMSGAAPEYVGLIRKSLHCSEKVQLMTVAATESGIHILMCIILTIQIFNYYGVDRLTKQSFIVYCTCIYIIHLVFALASGFLYIVTSKMEISRVKTYFKWTVPIYIFWILLTSVHMAIVGNNELVKTLLAAFAIYKLFSFKIVYYFIIDQNEYWKSHETYKMKHLYSEFPVENFDALQWNIDFEIPFQNLLLESTPIGAGRFGQVLKGTLQINEEMVTVAVKTTNSDADYYSFRSLLSELNILSCIGQHDHIVKIIGTCTTIQRKLHIVMEFCANGSINNFILARKAFFRNMIVDDQIIVTNNPFNKTNYQQTITTLDIMQWSYQTASGMEYLASKRIIHGDIAARNILLTANRSIKIADFGLSRQKTIYIKMGEEPLPWRWMSLESLCSREFSSKSDVWSYAVTLWEFFTLCEIPFVEFDYNFYKFINEVQNGLRLGRPLFCTSEIYKLMISCWEVNPNDRPDFRDICEFFERSLLESTVGLFQTNYNVCGGTFRNEII